MSNVGQKEIMPQKHVIQFFTDELGYEYLDGKDLCSGLHSGGAMFNPEEHLRFLLRKSSSR